MSWILFGGAIICVIWQTMDCLRFEKLSDLLILATSVLILLVISLKIKSARWFLLSTVTLLVLAIYISRDFWRSLAWWVYLLAAGAIMIIIASMNEYRKKNEDKKENRLKGYFKDWNV